MGSDVRQHHPGNLFLIISIHAPRVGSDSRKSKFKRLKRTISIHAPRVGSDIFSSARKRKLTDFNPRSPCGERLANIITTNSSTTNFNPRSPCGERHCPKIGKIGRKLFQSTLPVWGATLTWQHWKEFMGISIHAPRVGSDQQTYEAA